MKIILLFLVLVSTICFGQQNPETKFLSTPTSSYVKPVNNLTLEAGFELAKRATQSASALNKKITIAVLDASGNVLLLTRDNEVGPHNTEAARRKAYTALSTKTSTIQLLRNTENNPDTRNLNTLPELLLLSGGVPIWYNGSVIGSISVAGGGSPENDDLIATSAAITESGITTTK